MVDQENSALSMFDFRFDKSYGDPQDVRVLARRSLGAVTLHWQVNGGAEHTATTSEWTGGPAATWEPMKSMGAKPAAISERTQVAVWGWKIGRIPAK